MKKLPIIYISLMILVLCSCETKDIDQPGWLVPKTVEEDTALPSLVINGSPLHIETFGNLENPILIFLHGGPGSDYRAMISERYVENVSRYPDQRNISKGGLTRLQDQFFCVFYDRRGSGLSPRFETNQLDFQDQIDDLDALVQHFLEQKQILTNNRETKVSLFGLSFGGYVATAYTNQHPDKIDKVVLYEPRPFTQEAMDLLELTIPFARIEEDFIDMMTTIGTHFTPDSHARADFLRAVPASNNAVLELKEAEDTPYWRLGAFAAFEIEREIRKKELDIVAKLGAFEGTMLFLTGEDTKAAPDLEAYLNLMTGYYPRSESRIIPAAAHNGHWENPEAVVQAIQEFFN